MDGVHKAGAKLVIPFCANKILLHKVLHTH